MAIDIRAKTTCSLGELISGDIGDDYLQGSGLIKTRGSCEISGLISPAVGTRVTFEYTKNGVTRSIPRSLRVLSSFADPFRGITKVELGCKLTYLSDLRDPIKWTAFDDDKNNDFTEDDQRIITLPIRASSVMAECLSELGITASSTPLTNVFLIAEFDFSAGYVDVLSDLLVSESYFGYLDTNEILQIRNLVQDGGTGPVLTSNDIIDLGPIGVGQLPGEAVTVSYNSLRLKPPQIIFSTVLEKDGEEEKKIQRINWELDETFGPEQFYFVNYKEKYAKEDVLRVAEYSGPSYSSTFTRYGLISVIDPEAQSGRLGTKGLKQKEVVIARITKNYGPSIAIGAPFAKAILEYNRLIPAPPGEVVTFNNVEIIISGTNTYYKYSNNGEVIETREETYKTEAEQIASMGIDLAYEYTYGSPPLIGVDLVDTTFGLMLTELVITRTESSVNASKQIVTRYKRMSDTQHGQQAIAATREDVTKIEEANKVISYGLQGLILDGISVNSRSSGRTLDELPVRPDPAARINEQYSRGGTASNNWRTGSKAQLELALGSATAQRRVEFSMPYAPDDVFTKQQTGGGFNPLFTFYSSISSDAPAKANRYGRVQNRLLLGNRNGINLQVAPERMPAAPFDPVFVQAAGLTALYRTNGSQWAFDGNGIICSTDALYWGVAGRNS